jgi:HlyD family secretion protein
MSASRKYPNHRKSGVATLKVLTTLIVLAAVGGSGWFGYQKYGNPHNDNPFITKPLARGDIVRTVSATGTIEPLVKTIVGSEVSGKIEKWNADFNQTVAAGELLAAIDPSRFKTARNRSAAQLAMSQANAAELGVRFRDAQREYQRIERLAQRNSASENEKLSALAQMEASEAMWNAAKASVQSAEASLNEAEVDLDRTQIRSPIDGIVIARNIENGQTVAASLQAPELFVIAADLKRMQVNANVSEADIGVLKEGGPATFRVDAYPQRNFSGRISQIRFNATDVDGIITYTTLIEVENDDLALRPGMTANVTFEVARAANVVMIPNAALRFDPTPPGETTVKPGSRQSKKPVVYRDVNGQAQSIEIEIGMTNGAFTALNGETLKEGDEIIIDRNWAAAGGDMKDMTQTFRRGGR